MAPMTRRSQANTGVTKKVHRKRGPQPPAAKRQTSDSWELLDREGLNGNHREDTSDEEDGSEQALDEPIDVQSAMDPLHEMADRIGREVESFAQLLDEMLAKLPSNATESTRFEWANEVIQDFQSLLDGTVLEMSNTHGLDKHRQTRKEWSEQARLSGTSNALEQSSVFKTSMLGEKKAQQVKRMRDLQQEADLWDLFHIMLELRPFEAEAQQDEQERRQKLQNLGPAHRYTSEDELWERFELSSEVAVERKLVKMWLERTAQNQNSDMHDIVAELEQKAGRGKGLWTSGWMHTREKIKGEKRLRNWPSDVDSTPPNIKRREDNDLIVTRLDPDAPARQRRVLENPDAYFERAIWIACWEMLRRGTPWQDICQWCEERKEGWRASCLGLAADTAEPGSSRVAWRQLCRLAAQSGFSSDHEAAVFGLLGGNDEAVKKVCRSVDDRIYAYYSSRLLRTFDSFVLRNCPDKVVYLQSGFKTDANVLESRAQADQATAELLARLRKEPATKEEMLQPMKVIQSYLLADEVGSLLNTVGIMVGETARAQDTEGVIFFRSREPVDVEEHTGEREVALNPQTLRMAAHMSIVWRVLAQDSLEGDDLLEDDNIVVAYIQALRMAGKRDLIPIYAARLQEQRYVVVLGRVLRDISDGEEQNRMLKLLEDYNLNVIQILSEQMNIAFEEIFKPSAKDGQPLRILERTAEMKLHPGQRIIAGFLTDEVTQGDEALVTALQWFQLYHGNWATTFQALTEALTRCFLHGNLTCARLIVQTFPYEAVSLRKSYETISHAANLMDDSVEPPIDTRQRLAWDLMKRQSRTYYELELLVRAIEALARWRDEENMYISKAPKPSTMPSSLKKAKTAVSEAMEPLLKGILRNPQDDTEAANLSFIRMMCLPEVIIAYNTVLHAAGNLITRDALLESMDLSVAVAADDSEGEAGAAGKKEGNGLVECFQKAGRMRELVSSFALTSKVMLVLKAEGKPWKARKDREGKELGIWEIGRREGVND